MPKMAVSRDDTLLADDTERGATLAANPSLLAGSPAAAGHFGKQVLDVLVTGRSLTVLLTGSRIDRDGFRVACTLLRDAATGVDPAGVGLVVCNSDVDTGSARRDYRDLLGDAPFYVITDARETGASWAQLWTLREDPAVHVACAAEVHSSCALLAAEPAATIVPGVHLQAPLASAWLPRVLHLPDYADRDGRLDEPRLRSDAARAVDDGERGLARAVWPTPRMRYDAWLNRRLAIELTGLGTLVALRGRDPADFGTLLELGRVVALVRDALTRRSRELVATAGPVPVLDESGRVPAMPNGRLRNDWQRRWRQAVEAAALRHRNLLVLSPWDLFPAGAPAEYRYANLLPVLRFADACTFPRAPGLAAWTVEEYANFHRQAAAVLQQRVQQRQIADPD